METVLHSFNYSLDYLSELLSDVCECSMVRQAPGVPNHPAWTLGHLVFVSQMIGGVAGLEPWLEDEWANAFGPGSTPVAEALSYPPKEALMSFLNEARSKLTAAVENLDNDTLDRPFPDPSYKDVFPTIRHALTQVMVAHTAFHVGQISAWRRAMDLSAMGRSFE